MANTRQSTKRAHQAKVRQTRNQIVRSAARSASRDALTAIKSKDIAQTAAAYAAAIKVVSKTASKGGMPKGRAARKISRLTLLIKKTLPSVLTAKK